MGAEQIPKEQELAAQAVQRLADLLEKAPLGSKQLPHLLILSGRATAAIRSAIEAIEEREGDIEWYIDSNRE